ncbi:MAG TPA: LysM peptidoglycan-binding domain-containing protein [Solirubrobacteraceae bacterium]|nr:LysM peptidoglycan-binding domain-containing protein [Solirubrobacteraceae bacterium]
MRLRFFLLISAIAGTMLIVPAAASAYFVHVISRGESLSSIAAQDGLSVDALAAANGLSPNTQLLAGSTIQIPPQGTTAVTPVSAPTTTSGTSGAAASGDGDADSDDTGAGAAVPASTSTSGAYVVQPGDTLSAIAARSGVSVNALAAANGLNPKAYLLIGTVIHLAGSSSATGTMVPVSDTTTSTGGASYVVQAGDTLTAIASRSGVSVDALAAANGLNPDHALLTGTVLRVSADTSGAGNVGSADAATSQPVGTTAQGTPTDPPYPTPERVSSSEVGSIASANGVPAPLADAIGWQESGFNNDLVSSADARGVMQILPGTWAWIQQSLNAGGPPLAPASAADNVRGGVLLLHSLLDATGGDSSLAAAGYFQGLPSVEQHGMYRSTQQYVNSVLALERQFGGGG